MFDFPWKFMGQNVSEFKMDSKILVYMFLIDKPY